MHGFSMKLTDKRVDKILSEKGYKECEVFFSPISAWLAFFALLLSVAPPLLFLFLSLNTVVFFLIYVVICYSVVVLLNRSFAVCDREFLVIQSGFPFRRVQSFKFEEIDEVCISSSWKLAPLVLLGLQNNYVEVRTGKQKERFYCLFLDGDCYYENWTEKNLDDLERLLKSKGMNVKITI
jgi:hypothetical protein